NLGNLDSEQNRMAEARRHYEEALKTYRQLAQQNPDTYLPYVARTLNNLGLLDQVQNRMEEARSHYRQAIGVYQELSKGNPNRYAARSEEHTSELQSLTNLVCR